MTAGKFYTIDAHCHIYPDKIAAKAVAGTDRFYGTVSKCDGTVSTLLSKEISGTVDLSLVQSVATTTKQVRSINEFIANEVSKHPGRLLGLGTLHPDSEDKAGDIKHLKELGLLGVKLHPDIQGFKIDDERCLEIYEFCEKEGLPILFHTGDYRYDMSNPNRLIPILKKYSRLTVIGAHFGGWSIYEKACDALAGIPNLYVDCSSSFYYLSKEKATELIRRYGADRVLFGADFPMWKPIEELDFLMSLGLSDDEYRLILSENAKKVFKI